jgi:manganese/iron transport system permease protein
VITALFDPLGYEFMRNALAAGVLVGILCPVMGTYLIVQRMALLGDVIAHAVLPGLAIANAFNLNFAVGAFLSGFASTFVTGWIRAQSRVKADSAMTLTFSSFFGLGIILISVLQTRVDLEGLLFGDILSVTVGDVGHTAIVVVFLLLLVALCYRPLQFYTFDPLGAEAAGLPVRWLDIGLMAGITLAIVTSMQIVGVILVIALLIGPAITAYLWVRQLHRMMVVGSGLGILSCAVGMYISYYADLPSGPAIALVSFALFLLSLLFSPAQGVLTRPDRMQHLQRLVQRITS